MYRQFESSSSHVVQRENETRGTILKKLELKNPQYLYLSIYIFQDGDTYSISKDMNGVCRLTIKSATLEDSGEYICKINKQTDKTETVLTVVGAFQS